MPFLPPNQSKQYFWLVTMLQKNEKCPFIQLYFIIVCGSTTQMKKN